MKSIYVDTSVLIAKYKPKDEIHSSSSTILSSNFFNFIISHISLVELTSVISRQFHFIELRDVLREKIEILNFKERVLLLVNYIVQENNLSIVQYNNFENLPFLTQTQIFSDYSRAILQSTNTNLRTLDNLHFGAAKNIILTKNIHIDYFLTGDDEILTNKNKINKYFDFLIISPEDLVRLEI